MSGCQEDLEEEEADDDASQEELQDLSEIAEFGSITLDQFRS